MDSFLSAASYGRRGNDTVDLFEILEPDVQDLEGGFEDIYSIDEVRNKTIVSVLNLT